VDGLNDVVALEPADSVVVETWRLFLKSTVLASLVAALVAEVAAADALLEAFVALVAAAEALLEALVAEVAAVDADDWALVAAVVATVSGATQAVPL
jgi:hypothetical protein